jgi:transcriptional regulator with GAF, ATPase, and Fis domain
MLRFDRYLATRSHIRDLATGQPVQIVRARTDRAPAPLFSARTGRTLIDLECRGDRRFEIWEQWQPPDEPAHLRDHLSAFIELLDCARAGAPRAFDLAEMPTAATQYVRRAFAREARVRGWVPIDVDCLAAVCSGRGRWPSWLVDRSLVVFVSTPGLTGEGAVALLRLARRDLRPHLLVRTLTRCGAGRPICIASELEAVMVHEEAKDLAARQPSGDGPAGLPEESAARWAWILDTTMHGSQRTRRALDLAEVLIARDQPFEARALIEVTTSDHPPLRERGAALLERIDARATARASSHLAATAGRQARGWEMVDEFVGVLQMCQDVEDEQTALARVGAYVRERLQASSVAFVAREGRSPRILVRAGSEAAPVDLAVRSIDTGVAIHPAQPHGPAECACPVRHATEVIGALWCRWGAGMPVATDQAATLLGIAAAAAAPSLRLALARTRAAIDPANPVPELVGDSGAMAAVRDAIVRAAASPFAVVIEGESGSGKELAARAIHARSLRRERRFCALNCAALVDDLVEAELFGHVRGAFTGANADRAGVFEDASGGTLFLDEVAELGVRVQAKLLRTLQEGEVRRLGESMVRKVDVRIVAATNRPLGRAVESGHFRADLWYRLDVIRIAMPPLRERLADLPALVAHLWQSLAARTGSRAVLSRATVAALAMYDWPGNIRELQNVLASILVAAPRSGLIHPSALPAHVARMAALARSTTLAHARRQFDERYVRAALARAGGRTTAAARELGLSRQGLAKLMSRLGIADDRAEDARQPNVQ